MNAYKFTDEYHVQLLNSNTVAPTTKVVITTIQRLYSMLKGEEEFVEANEEGSIFEAGDRPDQRVVAGRLQRRASPSTLSITSSSTSATASIYNIWRQVLDYFDSENEKGTSLISTNGAFGDAVR